MTAMLPFYFDILYMSMVQLCDKNNCTILRYGTVIFYII